MGLRYGVQGYGWGSGMRLRAGTQIWGSGMGCKPGGGSQVWDHVSLLADIGMRALLMLWIGDIRAAALPG